MLCTPVARSVLFVVRDMVVNVPWFVIHVLAGFGGRFQFLVIMKRML